MLAATRTFRVFVSSTFEDLRDERNALAARGGEWGRNAAGVELETGESTVLQGPRMGVGFESVSITADGRRTVSGSEDETPRVSDLETGGCFAIARLNAPCRAVAVARDCIVADTSTGEVLFFDVRGLDV